MSDYLIEIIAELKDNASAKLKNLQREIDQLKGQAAASDLGSALGGMADEADRAAESHQDLNKAAQESERSVGKQKRVHDEAAGSVGDHADAVNDLSKAMQDAEDDTDDLSEAQAKLQKRVAEATDTYDDLSKSFRSGSGDLKELRQDLAASSTELSGLSKRFKTTSDDARMLRGVAEEASAMSKSLATLQSVSRQPILNTLGIDKAKQDLNDLTKQYEAFSKMARSQQEQSPATQMTSKLYASRFGSLARSLPMGSDEFGKALESQASASALAKPIPKETLSSYDQAKQKGDDLIQTMGKLDAAAQNHTASNKELEVGYKSVASGLSSVFRSMDIGSEEAEKFGSAMEDAGKKAGNIDFARSSSGISQFAQSFAQATDSVGLKVVSLSAQLRGLRLVGILGELQPLDTGLVSLAGSFFSVASGAGQAAATLGGVFLSGLGQLIPVVSVVVAALSKLKDILAAVQASQAAKQEAAYEPNQGIITQLQNTNQLIEAEQNLQNAYMGLKDAQVEVKESQLELTQARIDAIRNLQDLVIAERNAKLELAESNLSVIQAQQALKAAQASGSGQGIEQAQLALKAAQISQQQARQGVPRSEQDLRIARREGVAGSPNVIGAQESARQAKEAVQQQQQAIAEAQRQIKITNLQAAEPSATESQQQSTLNYLTSQFTPVQKELYDQIDKLVTELKSPSGPLSQIQDAILEPFIGTAQRLQQLLGDPSFLEPVQKLADSIGAAIGNISKTVMGPRGTSFFETMANDASKNVPIITRSITGMMKVFEDIATAAGPAFSRLSKDWANFWNQLDAKERSPQGQKSLENFFNQGAKWAEDFAKLGKSVTELFMALGHDAAPQGMDTVTSFTSSLNAATDWVKSHGPEVTNFFSQTRQGLSTVAGVLFNIGKAMLQVFSLTSLRSLADLLNTLVIPAARDFANVVGFLVQKFTSFVNSIGPLKAILEGLLGAFFGLLAINKVIGLVTRATDVVHGLFDAIKAFQAGEGIINKLGAAFDALTTRVGKGKTALQDAKKAQDDLNDSESKGADLTGATDAEVGAGGAAAGGAPAAASAASSEAQTAESGVTEAEVAGGGGASGLLAAVGGTSGLITILGGLGITAGAALLYNQLKPAGSTGILGLSPTSGTTGKGFAAELGSIGGTHSSSNLGDIANMFNPGGGSFLSDKAVDNQQSNTTNALKSLQKGLQGVTSPAQLSSTRLRDLYNSANRILRMPDITAGQRAGLTKLVTQLNPTTQALQKAAAQWSATFQGISVTTGNVFQNVKQVLAQDIQDISTNLGTGTKQGQAALSQTFASTLTTILDNTSAAVRGTQKGMSQINKILNSALKTMGEPIIDFGGVANSPGAGGASKKTLEAVGNAAARAQGGWNPATSGGMLYRAGEAGHDEVTLSTDPRHSTRTASLLSQFLDRTSMATGGVVDEVGRVLLEHGFNKIAAAGIIGNAFQESSWDPSAVGDGGGGLWGFTAGDISLASLQTFASGQHQQWTSPETQTNFLVDHISAADRAQLNKEPNPSAAAVWFMNNWERPAPATENAARREEGAVAAFNQLRGVPGALGHLGVGGGTGTAVVPPPHIKPPRITGVQGIFGDVGQGALNEVAQATNQYLIQKANAEAKAAASSSASTGGGGGPTASNAGVSAGSLPTGVGVPSATYNPLHKPIDKWIWPILAWAKSHGWAGSVTSGYRTDAEQESAAADYAAQLGKPISAIYPDGPLGSNHVKPNYPGGAVDINDQGALAAVLRGYKSHPTLIWGGTTIEDAVHYSSTGHAAGGLIDNFKEFARGGFMRAMAFASGGRAPWGGAPVPIIAHEGERVVNPGQWNHVAGMAGMSGSQLDHSLGYDGTPKQFAGGGMPTVTGSSAEKMSNSAGGVPSPATSSANAALQVINSFLSSVGGNLFLQDPASLTTYFQTLGQIMTNVTMAMSNIDKLPVDQQVSKLETAIGNFADPNNPDSTINQLATAFTRFQNNLSNWVTSKSFNVNNMNPGAGALLGKGEPTPVESIARTVRGRFQGTGLGGVSMAGPALTAGNIGRTGQSEQDAFNVRSSVEQTQFLQQETKGTQDLINKVKQKMQSTQHSGMDATDKAKTLAKLEASFNELTQAQENLKNEINTQVTTTFQDEQTRVQDVLDQVNDVYQTQAQSIQAKQSTAQSQGNYAKLPSLDKQVAESSQKQLAALVPALQAAKKIGDSDLVAQIQQQMSSLNETIGQSISQMVQDKLSGVEQKFQTSSDQLSALQTGAETMGNFAVGPQIDQAIINQTQAHIAALQKVLKSAQANGQQSVAAQIESEIAQLQGSVVQATAQVIQDAMSAIQQGAQTDQAKVAMLQSIAQTQEQAASTPGQFAAAGATNLAGLNINQASIQGQLAGYQGLLAQANATGNVGAAATITQTIDQLTAELVSNTQAITDNTATVVSETSAFIQSRGQFATGTLSGLASAVTTVGQTTGFTNVPLLQQLTNAQNNVLGGTQTGLLGQLGSLGGGAGGLASSLMGAVSNPMQFASILGSANLTGIESGQDATWVNTFESLIANLTQNTESIATNNQQLATLNGQLNQPQQWSTTAWGQFRSAIFSGMGNLLPQFQNTLPSGAAPTIAPAFVAGASGGTTPTIGQMVINHAPVPAFNSAVLGEQMAFEAANSL